MAEKRMFAKTIVDSDAFLDMPMSTQALYFHLNMRADDDGFVNNPKKIQRMLGASDDDLRLLIAKKFILVFESGIIVIKHWRINNYLRRDRFTETQYKEELAMLKFDENNAYSFNDSGSGIPLGIPMVDPDKIRLDKIRLDKTNIKGKKSKTFEPPTLEEVKEYAKSRGREDIAKKFFDWYEVGKWLDKDQNPIRVWKQKFIYWEGTNPAPIKAPSTKEFQPIEEPKNLPSEEERAKLVEETRERLKGMF